MDNIKSKRLSVEELRNLTEETFNGEINRYAEEVFDTYKECCIFLHFWESEHDFLYDIPYDVNPNDISYSKRSTGKVKYKLIEWKQ